MCKFCPFSLAWGLLAFWEPICSELAKVGRSPPAKGALPPWTPLCPPSWAGGLPAFWVPLVARLLMWATRPLLRFLGAHPPNPLGGGCAPSTPALIKVGEGRPFSKRLTSVGVKVGGHPHNPRHGATPPWPPVLPTPVGWGLAGVLGPPRGGVANVGNSPPFEVFGGTSPRSPARGLRPPGSPFCPPP